MLTVFPAASILERRMFFTATSVHFSGSMRDAAEWAVAVGTEITLRPPHRTRRALLTHRAPTLDSDEEPLLRPRMQDAWEWQVSISNRLHSGPG